MYHAYNKGCHSRPIFASTNPVLNREEREKRNWHPIVDLGLLDLTVARDRVDPMPMPGVMLVDLAIVASSPHRKSYQDGLIYRHALGTNLLRR